MTLNEYIKSKNDIKLSDSQSEAINKISDFLTSDTPCFILKGFAGTGKTFITAQIAQYLDSINYGVKVLTPTGRSAKVAGDKLELAPKFDQYGNEDHIAQTIHRGIYKFDTVDEEEEGYDKPIFKLAENSINKEMIYFIDEASMLSDKDNNQDIEFGSGKLLQDLIKFSNIDNRDCESSVKIIFIGDSAQLTPVNMSYSPALDAKYLKKQYNLDSDEYELTNIFRQDLKSGILHNATRLREDISKKQWYDLKFDFDQYEDIEELDSNIVDKYINMYNVDDFDDSIFITYSTANANKYNYEIRKKLFEIESEDKEVVNKERLICIENNYDQGIFNGEFLIVKRLIGAPIKITRWIHARSEAVRTLYKDKLKVLENENRTDSKTGKLIERAPIEVKFQKAEIECHDSRGKIISKELWLNTTILCTDDRTLTPIQRQALSFTFPPDYHPEKDDKPLLVKYGYSVVGHKAQGGEWNKAMIDFDTTIGKNCEDYFRWCYTVTTRAKEKNFFINIPESVNEREKEKHTHLDMLLSR